jgi:transposase
MAGLTISPRRHHLNLYFTYYPKRAVNRFDVIEFFRDLMRHTFGPIIVIADRGNIHRAVEVKQFLAKNPRITLEYLPPYAPDLNPVEAVWSNLKAFRLANFCPSDPIELLDVAMGTALTIQADRKLLRGFVRASGLPIAL